jgi:hypothetical protein
MALVSEAFDPAIIFESITGVGALEQGAELILKSCL